MEERQRVGGLGEEKQRYGRQRDEKRKYEMRKYGEQNYGRQRNKKKRRQRRKRLLLTIVVTLAFVFGGRMAWVIWENQQDSLVPMIKSISTKNGNEDRSVSNMEVDLNNLYSPYAILVDLDSGNILAERETQTRIYPASLTKIMTAILAIENTENMEEVITLPSDFFRKLYAENASMAGFQPGERACLRDLLYGILLPSGAECCMAFADRIAGSEDAFVAMMNRKAEELGLKNTHFCNATGLHDPEHYSTVGDISVLLQYALRDENFRAAFTSSRYSTRPSDQHPEGFTFYSTMFQYMDSTEVAGGAILGGKTGYTEEAGLCLASLAEVNGKEYILVTAKANGTHQTEQFHILDARNVYSQIGACEEKNKIIG